MYLSRRNKINSIPEILIVWLDNNFNEDWEYTIQSQRKIANKVKPFTNEDKCVDFLTDVEQEDIIMVISGALSRTIIPLIYDVPRLHSIFIHIDDERKQGLWSKEWRKMKGVFADVSVLCGAIAQFVQQYERKDISISFVPINGSKSAQNLHQLDQSFMYTQILKEIFLEIDFQEDHIEEFVNYFQQRFVDDNYRLKRIRDFREQYHRETAVQLYTKETFLYSMLNCALREIDVDFIMKMSFFLCDLHRQIKQLYEEQLSKRHSRSPFLVYRGQSFYKKDFDQMMAASGGLMSFNNFLSTSLTRNVSLSYAEIDRNDPDLVGILFAMTIDPFRSTTPFADVTAFSRYPDEDEILFSMHTVFRIDEIEQINAEQRLWQVNLTLTNDSDRDLRLLTDRIRAETHPEVDGWQRLGLVLIMMDEPEKAEQIYIVLIKDAKDDGKKAILFHQLGLVKDMQKKYGEAIVLYEESWEYMAKVHGPNHPHLIACYNSIGNAYQSMDEYSKAIAFYQEALKIQLGSLPANHPDLATTYNNIASAYYLADDNENALCFYENALEIQTKLLPANHPHLAILNDNIGLVYRQMGRYSDALGFHEIALEIRRKILPSKHRDLATSYRNIALVYASMGEHSKENEYNRKADEIEKKAIRPNSPDLTSSYYGLKTLLTA